MMLAYTTSLLTYNNMAANVLYSHDTLILTASQLTETETTTFLRMLYMSQLAVIMHAGTVHCSYLNYLLIFCEYLKMFVPSF